MDRLTVKSEIIDGHFTLKCMCSFGRDGVPDDEETCYEHCEMWGEEGNKLCECCGIQQAFDMLAAYEDTGLTPEQINKYFRRRKGTVESKDILRKDGQS